MNSRTKTSLPWHENGKIRSDPFTTSDYQLNSAYDLANDLLMESFIGGPLDGVSVTNSYDGFLRRTNLTALGTGILSQTTYSYTNDSRLRSVMDGSVNSASYSYVANSPLVSQIVFQQSGTTRMTTTKQYDYLNRLTSISSANSQLPAPISYSYNYNPANERTKNLLADGSYWVYQYDSLGQVTGGNKYFRDETPVPGQQFGYSFDDIGNRKQTSAGGDQTGGNLRVANYTVNNLNQITVRDYPGTNDVIGIALATNSVIVNGQTAWRKGEYFWSTVHTNNATSAAWENVTVASGGTTNNGNLFVPQTPEHFSYDADGNLTNDGRWSYTWDAENRLVGMAVNTNVGPQYQLNFIYDAKGRRIQKTVVVSGTPVSTNNFLYDGWNLIAVLSPQSSVLQSFVWGSDLSGSMQGAGGVGGLLEVSYYGSSTTNAFVAYDGNGNVMALVNAADGTSVANYEYGPFGETIRTTGALAKDNPFRFSTKFQDDESDLLYYGYRYCCSSDGGWLSRDPIAELGFVQTSPKEEPPNQRHKIDYVEQLLRLLHVADPALVEKVNGQFATIDVNRIPYVERDGANPYAFVANNPVSGYDSLGLIKVCIRPIQHLSCLYPAIVHCFLDLEDGTTFSYDSKGIHADPDPNNPKKKCVDVSPSSITAPFVGFAVQVDKISGDWPGEKGHCCKWVDHLLIAVGSAGVESYFPGYHLPP